MPQQRWQILPPQPEAAQSLARATQLSPLLTQVLLNRGIDTAEAAAEFINPELQNLPDPIEEFTDLPLSLELLVTAIQQHQKIAICGDYDADGMTSTALLMRALRFLGANANYAIPSRMQEGYGINTRIVEDFHAEGVGLILTVDNGIAAHAPVARARELGIAVIITDHHDLPPELPCANAILNPKLLPQTSPYWGVAGVGVAYILAICLAQCLGKTQDLTVPLLELFTLGTIADLAPLTGVNRRWVRRGLKLLPRSRIPGIQALIQVAGLGDQKGGLKPEAIGFRLGPRINAVGRIADPQIVIDMLTTDDVGIALQRAMQCEEANQLRQRLCELIEEQAIAWCEAQQAEGKLNLQEERVLVIVQPEWHHGVIGIVASRLVERYGVPVFICTYEDEAQKEIRGSARGIPEFNVFEALQSCHDLMHKYGGHKAAGGFSFPTKNLRQVRSRLSNFACQQLEIEHLKPLVVADVQANLAQVTLALYQQIDQIHPCGIQNPDPVFWTPNVRVLEQQTVGRSRAHLKLTVGQEAHGGGSLAATIKAIAWRWGDYLPLPNRLDIAYKLKLNEWKGDRTVELELIGVRLPNRQKLPVPPVPSPIDGGSLPLEADDSQPSTPLAPAHSQLSHFSPSSPSPAPSPSSASSPSPPPSPAPAQTTAEFYYSKRRYTSRIITSGRSRELTIHNPDGHLLIVQLPERQGFLAAPSQPPQPVDLSEPHYFNLVRAGLSALEVKQKTQLLLEKDELLTDKNSQIETLTSQISLLEEKISQLSTEQQQQFQSLQGELQQQEAAIQDQEAHIAKLQSQLGQGSMPLDPKALRQEVRSAVGDTVWFCLQPKSQKDLYVAYKHQALLHAEKSATGPADYSEAGLRLSFAVEREVIQPFFSDLYEFLLTEGGPEIGGLLLRPQKKHTLGTLPSLLADQWRSLKSAALKSSSQVSEAALYGKGTASSPMSGTDRDRLQQFLNQWDHPMSEWLQEQPAAAAAHIDQVAKLRNLAAHAESYLHQWHYDLLQGLVLGAEDKPGLFQLIYAA
ncbi:single-stranded-DNA-specific exonuclease RecJ [Sphaerothrix gracilis]|uniref:single-stranded-DNA-specific exonuclease RecJ n=1 Tax=Sphaerothrix gracilis TaxID=3151835 RepID=UPI0031FCF3BC